MSKMSRKDKIKNALKDSSVAIVKKGGSLFADAVSGAAGLNVKGIHAAAKKNAEFAQKQAAKKKAEREAKKVAQAPKSAKKKKEKEFGTLGGIKLVQKINE